MAGPDGNFSSYVLGTNKSENLTHEFYPHLRKTLKMATRPMRM